MSLPMDMQCRLLDACVLSYAIHDDGLPTSSAEYRHLDVDPARQPVVFADGPERINAGFVAETRDGWVVVAFRGTVTSDDAPFFTWVDDWLNDFRAGPMAWHVAGRRYGSVETGFGTSVMDLWPMVARSLAAIDLASKQGVLVTGHSKGAAMSFPAASLIRAAYPGVGLQVCCFAAPLTCDADFAAHYAAAGLDATTVRVQNCFDIVPFLPYWPHLALLAEIERTVSGGGNAYLGEARLHGIKNDYVAPGRLRFLTHHGAILDGPEGAHLADREIRKALEHLHFRRIMAAHGIEGRYRQCICGTEIAVD